jgi:hypothetical protein
MVQVGQMRVAVCQRLVLVPVPMRRRPFILRMFMPMVLIVDVQMLVLERLVRVHVQMAFRQHEPRGQRSEHDCNEQ